MVQQGGRVLQTENIEVRQKHLELHLRLYLNTFVHEYAKHTHTHTQERASVLLKYFRLSSIYTKAPFQQQNKKAPHMCKGSFGIPLQIASVSKPRYLAGHIINFLLKPCTLNTDEQHSSNESAIC